MRAEFELLLMPLTCELQFPNGALITSATLPPSHPEQAGQKREAYILLYKPLVIMVFYQKQRKVIPLISFRSTTETQSL